jgi:hypothetical protein
MLIDSHIIKKTLSFVTLLSCFSIFCSGQVSVTIPDDFVETVPPKAGSTKWYSLNHSPNEFSVRIKDGNLNIKKVQASNRTELKLVNGTLVGINRGEWGGQLTFKPFDTTQKVIEIKKGNVKFIFSFQDKIYFIEGLAHLSISEGALYELDITNHKFTYKKILDFGDAPEAFTIYHNKLLVATHENFYVLKDFKKEITFKDTFWRSLYKNSIAVIDDRNVFLGIRSGLVKLDLTSKTFKFYKYKG